MKWLNELFLKLLLFIGGVVGAIPETKAQLIISQYYEGASNDKCIEIYNTTSSAINLTGYNLQFYFNGAGTSGASINLTGTIAACGTWVVCDDNSNATLLGVANQVSTASFYNGDDAVALFNGLTMLDVFGNIGCDPGSEWTNVAPGTADGNFVRTGSYCSGVTTNPGGACSATAFPSFTAGNWTSAALTGTASLGSHTSTCCGCSGPVTQPTTETTADSATPGCTSVTITWTASTTADNVIVVVSTGAIGSTPADGTAYTANAVYGSGETIGANQYVVYNGSGTTITVTGLTIGTTYNYAIFGYDGIAADCEENYLTGGNFGSFTTLASCGTAEITTLMVNSCSGSSEGTDELIVIENGDEAINVNDMVISLPNTTWCNNGCAGVDGAIVNNPTYVSNLNAMAGCVPDLFVYADPIPAGATIIIFTGNPPTTVLDYSSNCGAPGAPVYVLFLDNSSITGNFANTGSTIKIIDIDFGNGQSDVVSYIPDNVANVDGGSINYDAAGNPTYYTSTGCVYPLSVRLAYLEAARTEDAVVLEWASYAEVNAAQYLIQRSADGIVFETIGELPLTGNSDYTRTYVWSDFEPLNQPVSYYRLGMKDLFGVTVYSNLVSVHTPFAQVYYTPDQLHFTWDGLALPNVEVSIYAMDGSLIYRGFLVDKPVLPFLHRGVFFVEIPELRYRTKISCF